MLPREARLASSVGFKSVYGRGRSYGMDLIVMYVLGRAGGRRVRFGFSAGKKVGNAVRRNRAKRLMREAARKLLPQIKGGWDIVIIARRSIVDASFARVQADIEKVLARAGLLSGCGE